jgi:hypothetical protein
MGRRGLHRRQVLPLRGSHRHRPTNQGDGRNPRDYTLYLQRESEEKPIRDDEDVHLHTGERFVATPPVHQGVRVFIDGKPYDFETQHTTGKKIKEKAGIADDYSLYLRREGGNEPIRDDEEVHLHEGEHFFSRPPSNVS